jgi:redox-sensitive bicupin YhaK (pirin superfamily)
VSTQVKGDIDQLLVIRPSASLFHVEGGWFSANWHFSFDHYHDPANTQWGSLRVLNDDRLVPGAAWPMHPHRDIEGITYVAEGTFEHADSAANDGVLPPGSVQRVTLGSGLEHSERNHSKSEAMRFIQLWILPARRGLPPSFEQRQFSAADRRNILRPVLVPAPWFGGPDAPKAEGAATVHQDAALYAGLLEPGKRVTHRFRPTFGGYLFVVHGEVAVRAPQKLGGEIDEGGAAKIGLVEEIEVGAAARGAEVLLVEVKL